MIPVVLSLLLATSPTTAAPTPPSQEEKDLLGTFVVGQMLDVQIAACVAALPGAKDSLAQVYSTWREKQAEPLAAGEVVFRKRAPEIAPGMSAEAYLEKLRQAERNKYAGVDASTLANGCNQLVSWIIRDSAKVRAPRTDFVSGHRSFSFSRARFSQLFPLDTQPLRVQVQPQAQKDGDFVQFFSEGGMFKYVFEIASWPSTGDSATEFARLEKQARAAADVSSLAVQTPCESKVPASNCLYFQDIVTYEGLPVSARSTLVFQANGWTYSVTAINQAPATFVKSKADLAGFHPEGSLGNSKAALDSMLGAITPLAQ